MLKRAFAAAAIAASIGGAAVWAWPLEAECKDCPAYNSPCISDVSCGFSCGMTCQEVPGDYRRRCR